MVNIRISVGVDTIVMQDTFNCSEIPFLLVSIALGLYRAFILIINILCTAVTLFVNICEQIFVVV